MAKHGTIKLNKDSQVKTKQAKAIVIKRVLLCFVVASAVRGAWTGFSQRRSKKKGGLVTAQNLTAATPTKEYVYAGGKLIGTEEPTSKASGGYVYDAQFVSMIY